MKPKDIFRNTLLCSSLATLCATATATDIVGVNYWGHVFQINSANGSAIDLGFCGYSYLNSLAKHPDGTIYAVSRDGEVLEVDPVTGAATLQVTLTAVSDPRAAAFRADGVLYVIDDGGTHQEDRLYEADISTGSATLIGGIGVTGVQGLAVDNDGTIFGWDMGIASGGLGLCTLDPSTAQATDVNLTIGVNIQSQTLFFDENGQLFGGWYSLYSYDKTTAQTTLIGGLSGAEIRGMEFVAGGIPGIQYCSGDSTGPGPGCPCNNDNDGSMGGCDWGNPAFPGGGVLLATGSNSMAANSTYLVAYGIENNFGIFFGAANQVNGGHGNPLNDGLRCAGGSLVRLTPPTVASGNQAITPLPVQVLDTGAASGVTRRYQYWFRTPAGPCGQMANLTNGYEIPWGA